MFVAAEPNRSSCTCFRVRRFARLLSQRYDRALAPAGLNVNQYSILRRAEPEPLPVGRLARRLGMDRTTLTRDLKPLLAAGLIALAAGDDARQRCVQVTARGRRAIARAQPLWRQVQADLESALGADDVEALHQRLDDAVAALR
jgi:DNA-binding MarR family transcriptional regulator